MEIRLDVPEVADLAKKLEEASKKAVPHAARNALNTIAFTARERWQRQLYFSDMVLRNRWTERSIQVDRARGTNVSTMQSVVGSTAPYMRVQEEGGTERKEHKHGVPIPTTVASGEGRGARPRRRLVRSPHRLPKIVLQPRIGADRRQRTAIAISQAARTGRKHVFLELEKRKGIFRLRGGKRRPKVDLVWDLSQPSVRIPATRTLQETLAGMGPHATQAMQAALIAQLQRHQVPGF